MHREIVAQRCAIGREETKDAVVVIDETDERAITGQATRGGNRQRRTVLDFGQHRPGRVLLRIGIGEQGMIDMHDHLKAVRRGAGILGFGLEKARGDQAQGIGPAGAP